MDQSPVGLKELDSESCEEELHGLAPWQGWTLMDRLFPGQRGHPEFLQVVAAVEQVDFEVESVRAECQDLQYG